MLHGQFVVLRAVERDDLKRVWELEHQNLAWLLHREPGRVPRPWAKVEQEWEKTFDDRDQVTFVIEVAANVVGTIAVAHRDHRGQNAQLQLHIVDPDFDRAEYSRDALALIVDWAFRHQNLRRLWIEALATDQPALQLYASFGFVPEVQLRQHTIVEGTPIDVVWLGLLRSEWQSHPAERR